MELTTWCQTVGRPILRCFFVSRHFFCYRDHSKSSRRKLFRGSVPTVFAPAAGNRKSDFQCFCHPGVSFLLKVRGIRWNKRVQIIITLITLAILIFRLPRRRKSGFRFQQPVHHVFVATSYFVVPLRVLAEFVRFAVVRVHDVFRFYAPPFELRQHNRIGKRRRPRRFRFHRRHPPRRGRFSFFFPARAIILNNR